MAAPDPSEVEISGVDAATRASVLVEALPYIQAFAGRTVVIKCGGNAMGDPALATSSPPTSCCCGRWA